MILAAAFSMSEDLIDSDFYIMLFVTHVYQCHIGQWSLMVTFQLSEFEVFGLTCTARRNIATEAYVHQPFFFHTVFIVYLGHILCKSGYEIITTYVYELFIVRDCFVYVVMF